DINLSNGRSLRFNGLQALSMNASGNTTAISNFQGGGSVIAQADNFVVQDPNGVHRNMVIDSSGTTAFSSRVDSTTAFQIQNRAGTAPFMADSSGMKIVVAGTNATFATLSLANAHFSATQTTAPTIGTPASCGTAPSAVMAAGSTDSAGSFTITT